MQKIKAFVRKIPGIGFIAWWVYSAVRAPLKLKGLSAEVINLKQEVRNLNTQLARESAEVGNLNAQLAKESAEVANLNAQLTRESVEIITVKQEIANLNAQLARESAGITNLNAQLARESAEVIALKQEVVNLNAQLTREITIDDVYKTKGVLGIDSYLAEAWNNSSVLAGYNIKNRKKDKTFYYAFESLFRGQPIDIEQRQSLYLPYIVEANNLSKGTFFLDMGCGRGEFLDLLRRQEIPAKGVDTDKFAVDLLHKNGFDVLQSDGLDFLLTLQDSTLKGLTMFQIIEHLDFMYIDNLLTAALQKLAANGVIILESVNPYCPIALGNFYLDPTHVSPMPPDLVKFILEWHGFVDVEIIYSAPLPKSRRFNHITTNYQDYVVITMNYQDYAVIGRKPQTNKKSDDSTKAATITTSNQGMRMAKPEF